MVSIWPQSLYPGRKRTQCPLNRSLGGLQSRPQHFGLGYTDYDGCNTKNCIKYCMCTKIILLDENHHYHKDILYCFEILSELICLTQFCHFLQHTAYDVTSKKLNSVIFSPLHSCKSLILTTKILHQHVHYILISYIIMVSIKFLSPKNHSLLCMEKDFKKDTIQRQLDRHEV